MQQSIMITQEPRNIKDEVSGDINKITQACMAAQENTGKLIENAISQALSKPQDIMPPYPAIDFRKFKKKNMHQILHTKQTGPHPGKQNILAYHNILTMRHITHRGLMKHLYLPIPM